MFSLICVWINDWVNNSEAGDLRRHRGHYDVNVMSPGIGVFKTIQFCNSFQLTTIFTQGQFWPSGIVVACVCLHLYVCVCPSITSLSVWQQVCLRKTPWLRSLLFWGFIDLDLQVKLNLKVKICLIWACEFVRTISQCQLKSGFPNFDQKCILALLRSLFILGLIVLDLQFHF